MQQCPKKTETKRPLALMIEECCEFCFSALVGQGEGKPDFWGNKERMIRCLNIRFKPFV